MMRDQERAALAYQHVAAYQQESDAKRKKYATIVHTLPALLQSSGLCQALHFVHSRKDEQKEYVNHLAAQLSRSLGVAANRTLTGTELLARVRGAGLSEYLQLTDEAMACAAWYRRLVQGVLQIEAGEEEGE